MKYRITVVGIIKKGNKILLGRKPKDIGPYPNTWVIPGGGINFGEETVEDALRREIKEEAGIQIKNIKPLIFMTDNEPDKHGIMTYFTHLVYMADYASGIAKAGDDVVRIEWIPIKEIPKLTVARPSIITFKKLGWLK